MSPLRMIQYLRINCETNVETITCYESLIKLAVCFLLEYIVVQSVPNAYQNARVCIFYPNNGLFAERWLSKGSHRVGSVVLTTTGKV